MVEKTRQLVEEIIQKEKQASESISKAHQEAKELVSRAEQKAKDTLDTEKKKIDDEARRYNEEQSRRQDQILKDLLKSNAQKLQEMEAALEKKVPEAVQADKEELLKFPALEEGE